MNAYDFDGTIYRGDSSVDFFIFCLSRYPWLALFLPYQIAMILAYKLHLCSKEQEKSAFFSFLRLVPDVPSALTAFWKKNQDKIESWYLARKQTNDVVISASPEFLLVPICQQMNIDRLIASKVNSRTGSFESKNCKGEEKVRRFKKLFAHATINSFYSDSESDRPMAQLAEKAFQLEKGNLKEWPNYEE